MNHNALKLFSQSTLVALLAFAGVNVWALDQEAPLIEALRTRPLQDVIQGLNRGDLPAPAFVHEKGYVADANKTFPLFLKLLDKERSLAKSRRFRDGRYSENLTEVYEYFGKYPSYMGMLLGDTAKRMILEWAQQQIANPDGETKFDEILRISTRIALRPESLNTLRGQQTVALDGEQGSRARASIIESSQQLWESYGYTEISDGYRGITQVLRENMADLEKPTSALASGYNPVGLALRLLLTEALRSTSLEGTVTFIKRGGDISKVSLADVRYFYTVLPQKECERYSFMALGKKSFDAASLLNFYRGTPGFNNPRIRSEDGASWMHGVLE